MNEEERWDQRFEENKNDPEAFGDLLVEMVTEGLRKRKVCFNPDHESTVDVTP